MKHRQLHVNDPKQAQLEWQGGAMRLNVLWAPAGVHPVLGAVNTVSDEVFRAISPTHALVPSPVFLWSSLRSQRVRGTLGGGLEVQQKLPRA